MFKYFEAIEELPEEFKRPLVKILDLFREEIADSIKRSDFERFEKATEENFNRVWKAIEELAEAQKKTEQRVEELAEAQRRTEIEVAKLAKGLQETRGELGGLSKSMSYAFENEAFRKLPDFLKERYGIEIKERLIREDIGGKEINIFGRARRDGTEIYVIGESKLRLDERKERKIKEVFEELEEKVRAVKEEYGEAETIKILIPHYATKGFLKKAKERGVIVVQSFEW
jgi:hypothetical protein